MSSPISAGIDRTSSRACYWYWNFTRYWPNEACYQQSMKVHPSAIDGYVIGEHGESQFVAWSSVRIGGTLSVKY